MKHKLQFILTFTLAFFSYLASGQISVTNAPPYNTANNLVQNVLLGSGLTATNITSTTAPGSIGFFKGIGTNLGLDSGIIMTSGIIQNAVGPNNNTSISTSHNLNGDPDLDQIMNPTMSYDACIIEFDFVPMADTVKFRYIFGSDEYMEWVSTTPGGINDGFGFFLSGPGITGPFSNNAVNIALIPGTSLPVTMYNLNLNSYGQYYFDNGDGSGTGTAPDGPDVQYDGFTVPLEAKHWVQCGQTYHIKLAIGDGGDWILDSGVFLEGGSFSSSGNVTVSSNISYGSLNDSTLYEGCGQACIIVDRGNGNLANADTVVLNFTGTAINGTDITQLPDTIFFAPAQSTVTVCINGISDALTEGPEALTLMAVLLGNSACSTGDTASLTLYIDDHTPLSVQAVGDTTICPGSSTQINAVPVGGVQPIQYTWTPAAGLSSTTIPNPTASPTITTSYVVSVSDSCAAPLQFDTVTVTVLPSGPVVANSPDMTICLDGNPVILATTVSGGATPYTYQWTTVTGNDTPSPANSQNPSLTPTGAGTYQVSVIDRCGNTTTDQVAVAVEDCITIIPNVISADGNGLNDFFVIKNLDHFPNSRLVIFDRWGVRLLDDPDYRNSWNAHGYVDGTYYFVLYRSDGQTFPGYVTVLRQ